jgi:hypothetical protein
VPPRRAPPATTSPSTAQRTARATEGAAAMERSRELVT